MSSRIVGPPVFGPGEPGTPAEQAARAAAFYLVRFELYALDAGVAAETVKAIKDTGFEALEDVLRNSAQGGRWR